MNSMKVPVEVNLNWRIPAEGQRPHERIHPNSLVWEDGTTYDFEVIGSMNGANREVGIAGLEFRIRVFQENGTYTDTNLYFEAQNIFDPKGGWYVARRMS